jgi:lysophospholipase L1-like esterase
VLAMAIYAVGALLFVALSLELMLRWIVDYRPDYYAGFSREAKGRTVEYPYGTIHFNSDGFPDDEFERPKRRPRIGYVGDSICYGVGAGYGYRVSELLETALPGYEHLNFGGVGLDLRDQSVAYTVDLVRRFELDHVIYLMNLNDLAPAGGTGDSPVVQRVQGVARLLDPLRGRSYLVSSIRFAAKNLLMRLGYSQHRPAYELYPDRFPKVFEATAERIERLERGIRAEGADLVVVIIPYEMQISSEAARVYGELGFRWGGEAFLDRGPQRLLIQDLPDVRVIDAYWAFVDPADPEGSRSRNAIGEYYVYNRGDRIDWNHPNRAGHRRIADYLARELRGW